MLIYLLIGAVVAIVLAVAEIKLNVYEEFALSMIGTICAIIINVVFHALTWPLIVLWYIADRIKRNKN